MSDLHITLDKDGTIHLRAYEEGEAICHLDNNGILTLGTGIIKCIKVTAMDSALEEYVNGLLPIQHIKEV